MEEQLISFETAKLAKEKGFNVSVPKYYRSDEKLIVNFEDSEGNEREYYFDADDFEENWNKEGWVVSKDGDMCFGCRMDNKNYFIPYSAPTQSLLQKWLREAHDINMYIEPIWSDSKKDKTEYIPWVLYRKDEEILQDEEPRYFNTYEEALEIGLQEALKMIE